MRNLLNLAAPSFRGEGKIETLSDLARRKAADEKIPFSEALRRVARARPELVEHNRRETLGDTYPERLNESKRSASERLAELARSRAISDKIPYRHALLLTAAENPDLLERRKREIKEI
jgi:hypothetical protein